MKKYLYLLLLFFLIGAAPTRTYTYTSGDTISSDEVTTNEDNIYTYLQGGVDSIKDATIVNADISGSANIASSKINLTSVSQNIANTGTLGNTGAVTITVTSGDALTIANTGTDDSISDDSGAVLTAAGVWTDAPCDLSEKTDVKAIESVGYIDKLKNLKLYEFRKMREVYGPKVYFQGKKQYFTKFKKNDNAPVHQGYILDDPTTPDELKAKDGSGKTIGISATQGVNFLLAVNQELIQKVEDLEKRIEKLEKK